MTGYRISHVSRKQIRSSFGACFRLSDLAIVHTRPASSMRTAWPSLKSPIIDGTMAIIVSLTPLTLFKRIKCDVPINHKQCDLIHNPYNPINAETGYDQDQTCG